MKRQALTTISVGFLIGFALIGCGREPDLRVEVPDRLTLYSIDGNQDGHDTKPGPDTGKTFYDYPVLGKVVVEDPKRREALIAALNRGIARSDGRMADCFWPRHALRLEKGGKTVDYLICFQCLQLISYQGGQSGGAAVDRSPQPIFDEELKRAGIPLARPANKGGE